jgi:hypothetical protein
LTGPRISQLPQQAHGLRGPPWFSFCLRVKSLFEFRAGTAAAWFPRCVRRRESERRGQPSSGPVRQPRRIRAKGSGRLGANRLGLRVWFW